MWVGRVAVLVAVATGGLLGGPPAARAVPPFAPPPGVPFVPAPQLSSYCWVDVRLFETLRLGPVDFCRRNLRYRPGRLECYRFIDQVCQTWVPGSGWVTSRGSLDVQVFPCPRGPEPPVCRRLDIPSLP